MLNNSTDNDDGGKGRRISGLIPPGALLKKISSTVSAIPHPKIPSRSSRNRAPITLSDSNQPDDSERENYIVDSDFPATADEGPIVNSDLLEERVSAMEDTQTKSSDLEKNQTQSNGQGMERNSRQSSQAMLDTSGSPGAQEETSVEPARKSSSNDNVSPDGGSGNSPETSGLAEAGDSYHSTRTSNGDSKTNEAVDVSIGPTRRASTSRGEVVNQIFGDVGDLVEDFTCALQSKILNHGRMYVTDQYVLFYSNIFGFQKFIKIPNHNVLAISKELTAKIIPNAISIRSNKREYVFRSFWDRDAAFVILEEVISRVNADFKVLELGSRRSSVASTVTEQCEDVKEDISIKEKDASPYDSDHLSEYCDDEATVEIAPAAEVEVEDPAVCVPSLATHKENEEAFAAALAKPSPGKGKRFEQQQEFMCSVNYFYKVGIADTAAQNIIDFHVSQGDWDVVVTPWEPVNGCDTHVKRQLTYEHAVKARMGPPHTRTVKEQNCQLFGDVGIILESETTLLDIPMNDYFKVFERTVVEASGPKSASVTCVVEVIFLKATFLKSVIEQQTLAEAGKVFELYLRKMVDIIPSPPARKRIALPASPAHVRDQAPKEQVHRPASQPTVHFWGVWESPWWWKLLPGIPTWIPWTLLFFVLAWEVWSARTIKMEVEYMLAGVELGLRAAAEAAHKDPATVYLDEAHRKIVVQGVMDVYMKSRFLLPLPWGPKE